MARPRRTAPETRTPTWPPPWEAAELSIAAWVAYWGSAERAEEAWEVLRSTVSGCLVWCAPFWEYDGPADLRDGEPGELGDARRQWLAAQFHPCRVACCCSRGGGGDVAA